MTWITAPTVGVLLIINRMAISAEKTPPGMEEGLLEYERQKHSPDHLSPRQVSVLRQVVNHHDIAEHALRSRVDPNSLSRALSRLAELDLVRASIDPGDRRKRILHATEAGEKRLAKFDADPVARKVNTPPSPTVAPAGEAASLAKESSPAAAGTSFDPRPSRSATRRRTGGQKSIRRKPVIRYGPRQLGLEFDELQ